MKTHAEMVLISMGRSTANVILTESTPLRCCGRGRTEAFESVPGIAPAVAQLFKTARFGHADLPPLSILAQQACHAVMAAFWFAFFIKKVQYGLMHAGLGTSVLLWRHGARAHFSAPWTAMLRCPLRPFSLCGERQYASSFPFICT